METNNTKQTKHNAVQRSYYEDREVKENFRVQVKETPYVANHIDHIIEFLDLKPGDKVLDVGCGMGKFTIELAKKGISVDAFDLSPIFIAEVERQAGDEYEIGTYVGDVLEPNPELHHQYNVVTGFFMLHHLVDLERAMTGIAMCLKPGGRAAFIEPNPWCPLFYLQVTFAPNMSWKAEKGILALTPSKTRKSMENAGFEAFRLERYGILPPFARNRRFGATFEKAFESIPFLKPVTAFQLIGATLPKNAT